MKRTIQLTIVLILAIFAIWMIAAPPRLWLNLTKRVDLSDPIATGQQLVLEYDCRSCHQIAGEGRPFGPNLDSVAIKLDPQTLDSFLRDPKSVNRNTGMPNFRLSDSEITAIIAYFNAID